jgi:hypothetical protein
MLTVSEGSGRPEVGFAVSRGRLAWGIGPRLNGSSMLQTSRRGALWPAAHGQNLCSCLTGCSVHYL